MILSTKLAWKARNYLRCWLTRVQSTPVNSRLADTRFNRHFDKTDIS